MEVHQTTASIFKDCVSFLPLKGSVLLLNHSDSLVWPNLLGAHLLCGDDHTSSYTMAFNGEAYPMIGTCLDA